MQYVIGVIALFLVLAIVVLLSAILDAYLGVKSMPRKPMAYCSKHGYYDANATAKVGVLGGSVEYCPRCYLDSFKD